jgi:hypothetical protein
MMQKTDFAGWRNCIKLYNNKIELVITTDVGPRIISCGFINGKNLLYVSPEDQGKTGGDTWRIYGGHRLWHSPEVMPRTYFPDNIMVDFKWNGLTLKLSQNVESNTGMRKEMEITIEPDCNKIKILHRIINKNLWDIELSPWAITACAAGGRAILPQEPYVDPADFLLPARPVVLWYYTNMDDPRWIWGNKYIQLKHNYSIISEQKIGILNKQGWAAYYLQGDILMKYFEFNNDAIYPDYGCNNEIYVNGNFLEIESLGPLTKIAPYGAVEHTEYWMLAQLAGDLMEENEKSIDTHLISLVNSFR